MGADGSIWRANDDGEPSGTGGKPILGQIRSLELTNVLIVVPRYFGGTLLGTSGLINAYRSAAENTLSNAIIINHIIHQKCVISFPYASMNNVMKILKEEEIRQADHSFELTCRVTIWLRLSEAERIRLRLLKTEGLEIDLLEVL
jgi:putative IMPACT (imprinted ancient) family translation regulator